MIPLLHQVTLMEKVHCHLAVQCDGCGMGPIRGIRYKCGNCKNYDLCSICVDSTPHNESHVFLRIKKPLEKSANGDPLLNDILYSKEGSPIFNTNKPNFGYPCVPQPMGYTFDEEYRPVVTFGVANPQYSLFGTELRTHQPYDNVPTPK